MHFAKMYGTIGKKVDFNSFEMSANLAENSIVTLFVFGIIRGFIKVNFLGWLIPLKCQCKKIILHTIDHTLTEYVPNDHEITLSPSFHPLEPITN